MSEITSLLLPVSIALIGSTTSIWIAVNGNANRRKEQEADRKERRKLLAEEGRSIAVEAIVDQMVKFADKIDALSRTVGDDPHPDASGFARPNDFELRGAIARLATRGGAAEMSHAVDGVLHAAKLRDIREVPEALGPIQSVLLEWVAGSVDESVAIQSLEKLKAEQFRAAERAQRLKTRH